VRNEIETKRNETKSTKTKRNETKRNEINKNETKGNEINEMKTKQNETNESKMKSTKTKRNTMLDYLPLLPTHVSVSFIRRGQDLITIEQEYYAFIQRESVLFT
jgi:hypothetical protein